MTLESLGIDRLTVSEKLDLIQLIWESLPPAVEPDAVPEWHIAELQKRLARAETHPGQGKPWREVLDRLASTACGGE